MSHGLTNSRFPLAPVLVDSQILKSPLQCPASSPVHHSQRTWHSYFYLLFKSPWLMNTLGKHRSYIYATFTFYLLRSRSGPSWFENWSGFFWVCDKFACTCIDLTVYIHTFTLTFINIPFTCTDKFGSKKMFSSQSNILLIFSQDLYLNCSYPVSL